MKAFIYGDFEKKFDRTEFKKIPGKSPEAIFFSESGRLVERVDLEPYTRWVTGTRMMNYTCIAERN